MTHDEIRDRLAAIALDSAERSEARLVGEHVGSCAECAAELASLRATAAELAHAVDPVVPPPALRTRILGAVAVVGQPDERTPPAALGRGPSRSVDRGRREGSAPRRNVARFAAVAVAASAALAVFLWTDLAHRREREALERELLVTRARAETAERELATTREKADLALAALVRERAAAALLADPATTNVALSGTAEAPSARARLAVHREAERAVLFCAGMPPAPAGKTYQLWFIEGTTKVPGGVFAPADDGTCLFEDRIPPEGRRARVFAVTLEPAGGVRQPTGEIFLLNTTS